MEVTGLTNLRDHVPAYDSELRTGEWRAVEELFERLGEGELPCAMNLGTRRILFQACRALGACDVLDVGTFTGLSALTFALAVGINGRVVSVDLQDVNAAGSFWAETKRLGPPRDLVSRADVGNRVDFVAMDSVAFLTHSTRTFDFICLDGWHEEEAVYNEIPLAINKLKPNGLLFLDDVQPHGPPPGIDVIPGPWRAIERHLDEGLGVDVTLVSQTLEGDPIAVAFVTRKPS